MIFTDELNMREIPMGLALALAENLKALEAFSGMSKEERQKIIDKTHMVKSKAEMHELVRNIK